MKLTIEDLKRTKICDLENILYDKVKYKKAIDAILAGDCKSYNWSSFVEDYSNFLDHENTIKEIFSAIDSNYKVDWIYFGISGLDLYKVYKNTNEIELTPEYIIKNILKKVLEYYNEKIYLLNKELILDGFKYNLDEIMKEDLLGNVKILGVSINELLNILMYESKDIEDIKKRILLKKISSFN